MPYTVYASERTLPPMTEYDISKGFTYMYLNDKPVFAFGRGLSYTTFDYSNLSISSAQVASDGTVQVHVDVKNSRRPRRRRSCSDFTCITTIKAKLSQGSNCRDLNASA